ncbi:MAG TPA: calcium/sodium antiporter [Anaerolineales bacterium]|nr:calcium/sodium antiporter [Anaerolineales bacterium]
MTLLILEFIGGLVILIFGADLLVRGASKLAAAAGIRPLVIGLTIVAMGTASPEIAVSLQAASIGQGSLTLGNVLGSNIFNILFVLGVTAIVAPIIIAEQLIRFDAPIMVGVSVLVFALAADGSIGGFDGIILIFGLLGYTAFALRQTRRESKEVHEEYAREFEDTEKHTIWNTSKNILFIVIGLGLLVLGARWLVESATIMAKAVGISELVIGLTVVAVGTSLPEVATSIIAALKGESDIAVGNAVGSNIYNLLGVLGLSGVVSPDGVAVVSRVLTFDFLIMVFVALVCIPVFYVDDNVSRGEGMLFLSYYVLYTAYLILEASQSSVLPGITLFVSFYVPLTFIGLIMFTVRARQLKKNKQANTT